jgi:hypothetical protein
MMDYTWVTDLEDSDRRVLLLAHAYERARQKQKQFGYKIFRVEGLEILKTPQFKQLRTVTKWLESHGWKITWASYHWQGYVDFVFRWMAPAIPMPGQLKNKRLFGEYIKSQPASGESRAPARYSWKELEDLYARKLRPELRNRGAILAALRLRQLQR